MKYWEWAPVFDLDPKQTALLIIDMQNGFVEPGSPLEVPMARSQISVIQRLLCCFRRQKLPVLFTAFCVTPDSHYPFYWSMAKQRGLRLEPPDCTFWPHKHETKITLPLQPQNDERVIIKSGYDGFANTELEQILQTRNIHTLVMAGTVVNWCVDSTVRSAYHRFYNSVVVADGVSGYDHAGRSAEDWCQMELDLFAEAFGRVMSVEEIIKELIVE